MAKLCLLGAAAHARRPINQPVPLVVYANLDGFPTHVVLHGMLRQVEQIQDRWQRDDEGRRERPISRMYFDLRLEGGTDLACFKDLEGGQWFEQRG
jgi:hypothetical protein